MTRPPRPLEAPTGDAQASRDGRRRRQRARSATTSTLALNDQYDAVCATATHVVDMIAAGWNVVLTHGNGPQVGFILRRSEIADGQVPTVPVQYAVADTQGAIGFMFQNAIGNALLAPRHRHAGRDAGHADLVDRAIRRSRIPTSRSARS